jgi:hypothetical protein
MADHATHDDFDPRHPRRWHQPETPLHPWERRYGVVKSLGDGMLKFNRWRREHPNQVVSLLQ